LAAIREAEEDVSKLRLATKSLAAFYGEDGAPTVRAKEDLAKLEEQLATLRTQRRESLPPETRRHRLGQARKEASRKLANTRAQLEEVAAEAQRLEDRRQELLEREAAQERKLGKLEDELQTLEPDTEMEENGPTGGDEEVSFSTVTQLRAELVAKDEELEALKAQLASKGSPPPGEVVPPGGAPGAASSEKDAAAGRVASVVADLQGKRPSAAAGTEEPPPKKK
jgi:DNA repair exonuclease SbcCD ATPase subunit